jgi:UDP-N-acetylmuramyl pentapeptide synthase
LTGVALTATWIADAVAGELTGRYEGEVGDVVTDSRTMRAGDVFVALSGPRFDGHDFVDAAIDRGAAMVVVSRAWAADRAELLARGVALVVDDPLRALQALARALRRAV